MMPSLPCESTQNLLPNDTHLVLLPNRQWDMMSSCHVMKVLKNSFLMIPISYFIKKGNVHTCTNTHVQTPSPPSLNGRVGRWEKIAL